MSGAVYEVLALRYGTRVGTRSETYLNHHLYGEPDGPLQMDYFLWVARNDERVVVIDTGYAPGVGRRRGRDVLVEPVEALRSVGVDAARAAQVVLTHAHYDHIGNIDRFPAAEVFVSRRELDFWNGPYATRRQFSHAVEGPELEALRAAGAQGRVTPVDGRADLAPGIEMIDVGGHTPGQMVVIVRTGGGQAVLASDAVHYYEEYDKQRPFATLADLEDMYRAYDLLREVDAAPGSALVAGHDPEVMERFPPYDAAPAGLAVRIP